MTDRELVRLAAKAARIDHPGGDHTIANDGRLWDCNALRWWNPLTDNGDAFSIQIQLRIIYGWGTNNSVWARGEFYSPSRVFTESNERNGVQDEYAAARRAIVRVAADMGESL